MTGRNPPLLTKLQTVRGLSNCENTSEEVGGRRVFSTLAANPQPSPPPCRPLHGSPLYVSVLDTGCLYPTL